MCERYWTLPLSAAACLAEASRACCDEKKAFSVLPLVPACGSLSQLLETGCRQAGAAVEASGTQQMQGPRLCAGPTDGWSLVPNPDYRLYMHLAGSEII